MVLTVLAVHALVFLGSAGMLVVLLERSGSRFARLVLEEHRAYLLWTNLALLRGYFVTAAGSVLLLYPVVLRWLGSGGAARPRRAVIWRTLAAGALLLVWFGLRLSCQRPYFLPGGKSARSWSSLVSVFPQSVRPAVDFTVFELLPAALVFGVAVFYVSLLLRSLFRNWTPRRAEGFSLGACALLAGGWLLTHFFREGEVAAGAVRREGPLNVLILASDSLRADRLSCNGYPRPVSPNIDRLAERSVNFTEMMTPIASTLESMTSIMTGQYPHTHGIRNMFPSREEVSRALRDSPQLADILKRNGYRTTVLGDWCACIFNFMPLGFENIRVSEFDDFRLYVAQAVYLTHIIMPLCFDNDFGYWLFPKLKSFAAYVTPSTVTRDLDRQLREESGSGRPFFITAFYSCTHFPYYCPPPYNSLFADPAYQGRSRFKVDFDLESFVRGSDVEEQFKNLPPAEVRQIQDLYDGSVRFFDDEVGKALASLERHGLSGNTVVIIMSDHGDDLFEPNTTFGHGLGFNGGDQTNHLPFIFHVPGDRYVPNKVRHLTRTIDLAPTVLELAGLAPEPRFEGRSLIPYFEDPGSNLSLAFYGETSFMFLPRKLPGEEPLTMPPFEETTKIDPAFDWHFVVRDQYREAVTATKERCLRTERWKLIFTPDARGGIWRLFDLKADPHCQRDAQSRYPQIVKAMRNSLNGWMLSGKENIISEIFPDSEPYGH